MQMNFVRKRLSRSGFSFNIRIDVSQVQFECFFIVGCPFESDKSKTSSTLILILFNLYARLIVNHQTFDMQNQQFINALIVSSIDFM